MVEWYTRAKILKSKWLCVCVWEREKEGRKNRCMSSVDNVHWLCAFRTTDSFAFIFPLAQRRSFNGLSKMGPSNNKLRKIQFSKPPTHSAKSSQSEKALLSAHSIHKSKQMTVAYFALPFYFLDLFAFGMLVPSISICWCCCACLLPPVFPTWSLTTDEWNHIARNER